MDHLKESEKYLGDARSKRVQGGVDHKRIANDYRAAQAHATYSIAVSLAALAEYMAPTIVVAEVDPFLPHKEPWQQRISEELRQRVEGIPGVEVTHHPDGSPRY